MALRNSALYILALLVFLPNLRAEASAAAVNGKVTSSKGVGLSDVAVTLSAVHDLSKPTPLGVQPAVYKANTDAFGRFSFKDVEPGRYILRAEDRNTGRKAAISLAKSLAAGEAINDLSVTFDAKSKISGSILCLEGNPLPGAQVTLLRKSLSDAAMVQRARTVADKNGQFVFSDIGPGDYFLLAKSGGRSLTVDPSDTPPVVYAPTFYPGVTDLSSASPVRVVAASDSPNTNITLVKSVSFRVRGHVESLLPEGQRLIVALMPNDGSMPFEIPWKPIGPDGSFDFANVFSGSYTLHVETFDGTRAQYLARRSITVDGTDLDSVSMSAHELKPLAGVLKTAGSGSTSGLVVSLVPSDGLPLSRPTAAAKDDGTFLFSAVPSGRYRLKVDDGKSLLSLNSALIGNRKLVQYDKSPKGSAEIDLYEIPEDEPLLITIARRQ